MGRVGEAAYSTQLCIGPQHRDGSDSLAAVTRALAAAAASSSSRGAPAGASPLSRSGSDAVDSAVSVLAEASRSSACFPGCCQPGGCTSDDSPAGAAASMERTASGAVADMAAMLSAHRQMATAPPATEAVEVQENLRACSGVLESAAKSACEASAKAGPTGGLAWQIAILDAMPLGPTTLDYDFTARGNLPEGVQQSKLAEAFGPEPEGEDTPRKGKAARVQIGNALVALLESHRKQRYTVASADPQQIIQTLGTLPEEAPETIGVDRRARSLTRSLTRSAASSPLVQLLATHRKRREDLTGWRDEASCSSDDEIPHVKLSSPLPSEGSAGNLLQAENALSLKPLLTSAARGNAPNQLPPLPHALAKQAGDLDFLRPACPCPGSPTEPPLPPSTRSSVDDRSSMCSYRSAVAESMASRASSDAHAVDWAAAESSIRGGTPQHGRSSLDGISVVRRSTDGRSSFEGRPPLPGQPARRAEVAEALRAAACAAEPMQSSLLEGQCSGCGSMTACCCKEMELGSHPDLETVPEDFASISDMVGPAAGEGASLIASLGDGGCSSVESNNNLRRLLLKQLPSEEGDARAGPGSAMAQRLGASCCATFSEVLESCMRSNSSSASGSGGLGGGTGHMAPISELPEPFIPMTLQTSSGSSVSDDDKLDRQHLGRMRAWSFDDTLQRQHLLAMRPGVLNRHSMDADNGDKGRSKSNYATLMAEYRNRMGMDRSSRSSSLSRMAESPSASTDVTGALKQAFRSQLQTPSCSPPSFESPLLKGGYHALRPVSKRHSPKPEPANPWESRIAERRERAQVAGKDSAKPTASARSSKERTPSALENWPSDKMEHAASGDASAQGSMPQRAGAKAGGSALTIEKANVPAGAVMAPQDAAVAARASLLSQLSAPRAAASAAQGIVPVANVGRPPALPRRSMKSSISRTDSAVDGRQALAPAPSGATAAAALGIAWEQGARGVEGVPLRRQSCVRMRASLELRRRSVDAGAPAPAGQQQPEWQPAISFPLLPSVPVPAQLPITFLKGAHSQRPCLNEPLSGRNTNTSSVLEAVAAQLGQGAAPCRATVQAPPQGARPPGRKSLQLPRFPVVEEGISPPCNARELSLNLGVPNVQEQLSLSTSPPDASHEPPDMAAQPEGKTASGSAAAGRLAAAHQLFFQGPQPARRRMPTATGALAADNLLGPQQLPVASPRLRALHLAPPSSIPDSEMLLKRAPRPSSPGTPPAVSEASPFSPLRSERASPPPPRSFIMQGLSEGVLHSTSPGPAFGQLGQPYSVCMPSLPPCSVPELGPHNGPYGTESPNRSTTGSHEMEDTYGAYRLRADLPWAPGSVGSGAAGIRHTVGGVAPSSFWLEHRAAAHHTAAGAVRGHVSMDETRLQSSNWLMPAIVFPPGAAPEVLSEDAECLSTARRDNYVARTFSHMARARLDHAVSRSADMELLEKWEMRFCDDGPCTLSQSGASEEGAISKAKRMMSEAATAQASIFMRGEGTDQRDVDGTCCLLDTLAAPKVSPKRQQDILSTLAFLTLGSEVNAGSVVASRGMATLVPLLGRRSEKTVISAARVIANLLASAPGQDAFVEENGLLVLSSLLSTSRDPALLQAVMRCLAAFVKACVADDGQPDALDRQAGQLNACGRAVGNVLLLERSRAIQAAVRLSCAHASGDIEDSANSVSLAALQLLLKVAAVPEMRTTMRTAGLMSALATIVTPEGGADTALLLEPAIQLVAALASDIAAAVEFTAGGGVLGLLAILSDNSTRGSMSMHAATVLGALVNCRRVRGAIWAAGGGSVLLPSMATASPQALRGLLYLLSCLAKYSDMRAEMESAGAVDVLLELLGSCHDTKVQAATLSLLRILTKAGRTLCAIPENRCGPFGPSASFVLGRASAGRSGGGAAQRRSLDGPTAREARDPLAVAHALVASGRSQSLCLF